MKTQQAFILGALVVLAAQSCAGAKVVSGGGDGGSKSGDGGSSGAGGDGNGGQTSSPANLAGILDAAPNLTPPDTRPGDPPPDLTGCKQDDAGNWTCCPEPVSILSLGQPASANYGAGSGKDSTDAFTAFMNGNTNGTATMQMQKTFKHITDMDLSKYDLIILQALYTQIPYNPADLWSYTAADAAALRDWVKQGGALVTMSGYWSDQNIEINPLNQLLSGSDNWSGITYNGDDTFSNCPDNLCYCASNSVAFSGWTSNYADDPQLTHDLKKVGVFHGRSIKCTGADCQVFAKDPTAGVVGVAKKVGDGRIFAWGDEWVTYTSQWGLTPDPQYDTPPNNVQCDGHTPMTSYSVPQFWYNAFRWLVPWATCFTIIVPPTADPGQQIVY